MEQPPCFVGGASVAQSSREGGDCSAAMTSSLRAVVAAAFLHLSEVTGKLALPAVTRWLFVQLR